jgi:hypothetical protein
MDDIWPDTSHKERDAYYQAGHAVFALREPLEVIRVSIQKEDDASSWIDVTYPNLSQSRLNRSATARSDAKSVIRALLAGPAAQSRYSFGTPPAHIALPDFNLADPELLEAEPIWYAIALATKISNDSPSLIRALWKRVAHLIQGDEVWAAIEAVAKALLINGELAGCEVRDIARHAVSNADR